MSCGPMPADSPSVETTEDAVLGGRLRLRQPKRGHRVGHDAILLAAATAAFAGEQAVDLGAGVGGAGLALAVRVPGLAVTLVEIDAGLCALADGNARRNAMAERVRAVACDAADGAALAAAGLAADGIDRVLMKPPFNDARRQNVSPDPRRRLAHAADSGLLARWIDSAGSLLKPQGTLTLIWRADGLDDVLAALTPAFGGVAVLPVWPRPGAAAIRVLVRAVKSGAGARRDLPALVLNDDDNRPSAAAEAVLRGGETLALAQVS
ncbi:MAG: methyltransferase [Pseudolabrys sp.]|nr:methyltransferase [Pseudolabrys sp.]